ncbi:MAG: FadR/GntR family transcriptional regulator [Acidimicrobiales bacterium]
MNAQPMEPVELAAAYELVVAKIRRSINLGVYLPGTKLPPERMLAEQVSVSRTTLREAIRVLEGEGYVVSRRGVTGGITVVDRKHTQPQLRRLLTERFDEYQEFLDFRLAVECAAARLAAVRRTKSDLKRLAEALDAMDPGQTPAVFNSFDTAFHLGIVDTARNSIMRRTIEDARAEMWIPVAEYSQHVLPTAVAHHQEIYAAIKDKDPDRAAESVAAHIESVREDMIDIVKRNA